MTLLKEKAVEMIRRMPEDNMPYVISILQNLEAMSIDKDRDKQRAKAALTDILNMEKRLPSDFDLKKQIFSIGKVSKLTNRHNPSDHFIQCKKVF